MFLLIINSDDFGYSPEVNAAINIAFQNKLITSTTTLVNFNEGLKDALNYLITNKIKPEAVGIHLNLTEGQPISTEIKNSKRFCLDGLFHGNFRQHPVFKMSKEEHLLVYNELDQQIMIFINTFGFIPSHIDSHHHIHNEWAILNCIVDLAKKYNISSIRLSRNCGANIGSLKLLYKSFLNFWLKINGFKTTRLFGSIDDYFINGLKTNVPCEIMVHALLSKNYDEITDIDGRSLTEKLGILLKDKQYKLINYSQLY